MFYRRHLPHWDPGGEVLFLTWRLHRQAPERILALPAVAEIMDSAFLHAEERLGLYRRLASTVMPDHVHLLIVPKARVERITHSLKSFTAHRLACEFALVGRRLWQRESFDHWLRTDAEIRATARYIVQNPVRKGLVGTAESWPWSWVSPELQSGVGPTAFRS